MAKDLEVLSKKLTPFSHEELHQLKAGSSSRSGFAGLGKRGVLVLRRDRKYVLDLLPFDVKVIYSIWDRSVGKVERILRAKTQTLDIAFTYSSHRAFSATIDGEPVGELERDGTILDANQNVLGKIASNTTHSGLKGFFGDMTEDLVDGVLGIGGDSHVEGSKTVTAVSFSNGRRSIIHGNARTQGDQLRGIEQRWLLLLKVHQSAVGFR